MTFRVDDAALKVALESAVDPQVRDVAARIAADAQRMAPKRTGKGAASIHAEAQPDGSVRVSWDPAHFYMLFQEFGTQHQTARPFLRPAAYRKRGTV